MPRGPGGLYRSLAMELKAAAWRAQLRAKARIEILEAPSLKEVHILVGGQAFSFKISERKWWISPRLLYTYAKNLLRHAKEHARSAQLILLLPRLTGGALRLASRLRWVRVIPYRVLSPRALAYWLLAKLLEAVRETIRWRRERGLPTRWLQELSRETEKQIEELRKTRK